MTSSLPPEFREPGFPGHRLMMLATLITMVLALWYLATHLIRDERDVAWHAADAPCDLHRIACTASLDGERRLRLAADAPEGIHALERLPLTVTLEGVEADTVRVDLVGRDMDMGLHRFPLEPQGDGRFHGVGQIPLCTEADMVWQARVVVEGADGRIGSHFDFDVKRSIP